MSYIDSAFYKNVYLGQDAGTDFARLEMRASDDIDNACDGFVFDELEDWRKELVKRAVAAQVEYYVVNGETYNNVESGGSLGSFSAPQNRHRTLAPRATEYLYAAGLLTRVARIRW